MDKFVLRAKDVLNPKEEIFTFESEKNVIKVLISQPSNRRRTYTVQVTDAAQDTINAFMVIFTTAMKYCEFHRDPSVGFYIEA